MASTRPRVGLTTLEEVLRVVSRADGSDRLSEAAPADEPRTPPRAVPGAPDAAPTHGTVLVVEDSSTITSVVRYFLELEGFTVLAAENGLLGLEMAFRDRPDVIVSDVNMPGMGGLAMVKALRGDPRTAQARILMLTSESSVESESEALAAGADDYILKPVEPRRLAARVKALLARSRPSAA